MTSPRVTFPEAGDPGLTLETITPSGRLAIAGLSLSISATFKPIGSDEFCDFAGTKDSLFAGSSPRENPNFISSPSLITFAYTLVSGCSCPTTWKIRTKFNFFAVKFNYYISRN